MSRGWTIGVYFPPEAPAEVVEAAMDRITIGADIPRDGWDPSVVGLRGDPLHIDTEPEDPELAAELAAEQAADEAEAAALHAAGEHAYCDVTCEVELPTEHLRNFILAKGYPGTAGALDELLRRAGGAPAPVADGELRDAVCEALWAAAEHNIIAEWICCEPLEPDHDLCAQGYAAMRMIKALIIDDPKAATPAPLAAAVLAAPAIRRITAQAGRADAADDAAVTLGACHRDAVARAEGLAEELAQVRAERQRDDEHARRKITAQAEKLGEYIDRTKAAEAELKQRFEEVPWLRATQADLATAEDTITRVRKRADEWARIGQELGATIGFDAAAQTIHDDLNPPTEV